MNPISPAQHSWFFAPRNTQGSALVLALLLGTLSCDSGPSASSSSHWFSCVDDADCGNFSVPATCSQSGETEGHCVDEDGEPIESVEVLREEFDGATLDTQLFRFETGAGIRNEELQTYTEDAQNVFIEGGDLVLAAVTSDDGATYSSGSLELAEPILYGRIEASIMTDVGSGVGPSMWLLPADPGAPVDTCVDGSDCSVSDWPAWGGIVVMSGRADGSSIMTVSYAKDEAGVLNLTEAPMSVSVGPTMSTEYHLYAIEWGPERIDWYVDEQLVHSFEFAADTIYEPEGLHPFRQPFRLKLSLSVGGLVEPPTPEDYPRQMRIRSLRLTRFE